MLMITSLDAVDVNVDANLDAGVVDVDADLDANVDAIMNRARARALRVVVWPSEVAKTDTKASDLGQFFRLSLFVSAS